MFFFVYLLELVQYSPNDQKCLEQVGDIVTKYLCHFFSRDNNVFLFYITNYFLVSLRDIFILGSKQFIWNSPKCNLIAKIFFFIAFEKGDWGIEELKEMKQYSSGRV
jgi:hypothetical protein